MKTIYKNVFKKTIVSTLLLGVTAFTSSVTHASTSCSLATARYNTAVSLRNSTLSSVNFNNKRLEEINAYMDKLRSDIQSLLNQRSTTNSAVSAFFNHLVRRNQIRAEIKSLATQIFFSAPGQSVAYQLARIAQLEQELINAEQALENSRDSLVSAIPWWNFGTRAALLYKVIDLGIQKVLKFIHKNEINRLTPILNSRNIAVAVALSDKNTACTPAAKITGYIDGFVQINGTLYLSGWACQTGSNNSVVIHVYRNGAAGAGQVVEGLWANLPSETAVQAACGLGHISGNHRFRIPMDSTYQNFGGQKLYVHGIALTSGVANSLLHNSGVYRVPYLQQSLVSKPVYAY